MRLTTTATEVSRLRLPIITRPDRHSSLAGVGGLDQYAGQMAQFHIGIAVGDLAAADRVEEAAPRAAGRHFHLKGGELLGPTSPFGIELPARNHAVGGVILVGDLESER